MGNFIFRPEDTTGKEYILDKPGKRPDFLQFVPASVKWVVNSEESAPNIKNSSAESNAIVVEKNVFTSDIDTGGVEIKKYYPLFRGISDSVTIGDLVLITLIGDIGYYLGPINITNTPSSTLSGLANKNPENLGSNSATYPGKKFARLVKKFKPDLDDPENVAPRIETANGYTITQDIHTDLVLEGRHGNSIRIGSRNIHPNIVFSNGRSNGQTIESINDSSIFGMFKKGSLNEHFNREYLDAEEYEFKFSDESIEDPTNTIKSTFTTPLGRGLPFDGETDSDIESTIYGYNLPFSIFNSDRIIINARRDNMFLSAFQHIHLGAGKSLTFSTSGNTIFNSTDRFDINAPEVRLGSAVDEETQPIVLGDTLVEKLTDLCDQLDALISNITSITVPTTQGPSGTPINAAAFQAQTTGISQIASALDEILSKSNRTT